DQRPMHDQGRRVEKRHDRLDLDGADRPRGTGHLHLAAEGRSNPPARIAAVVADAVNTPCEGRPGLLLVPDGPGAEEAGGQGADGRVVGCELEAKGAGRPANDSVGSRRSHEAGTIAPCRLSSSRNAETSRRASSPLSSGNRSRRAIDKSWELAGVASRSQSRLPV